MLNYTPHFRTELMQEGKNVGCCAALHVQTEKSGQVKVTYDTKHAHPLGSKNVPHMGINGHTRQEILRQLIANVAIHDIRRGSCLWLYKHMHVCCTCMLSGFVNTFADINEKGRAEPGWYGVRAKYVEEKDIRNIQQALTRGKFSTDEGDSLQQLLHSWGDSVLFNKIQGTGFFLVEGNMYGINSTWTNMLQKEGVPTSIPKSSLYEKVVSHGSTLPEDAINIVLQTEEQKLLFRKYGHQCTVQYDYTHGTNKYNFSIGRWTVVDVHGKGRVVASHITNYKGARDFSCLCLAVLAANPTVTPACFVTDDDDAEYKAIRTAYTDMEVFLCQWHVLKNWNLHIPNDAASTGISDFLDLLLYAEDIAQWRALYRKFQKFCDRSGPSAQRFFKYFQTNYVATDARVERWATFKRRKFRHASTTGYTESSWNAFKLKYLHRKVSLLHIYSKT